MTDTDFIRTALGLEVVSEQEDGFVVVATRDFSMTKARDTLTRFEQAARGGGAAAKVYRIHGQSGSALAGRIISEDLLAALGAASQDDALVVDISIECAPHAPFPTPPEPGVPDFEVKQATWEQKRSEFYQQWDAMRIERENRLTAFVVGHHGQVLDTFETDMGAGNAPADTFTMRVRISKAGILDVASNYPFVFEIGTGDTVQGSRSWDVSPVPESAPPIAPSADAPRICVIDSGIQEGHRLLAPGIDSEFSRCFLPNETAVADEVSNGGHGTRVAGAILFDVVPPQPGTVLSFWIRNARILDEHCALYSNQLPSRIFKDIVSHFHTNSTPRSRIFNHSITGAAPFLRRHMSAWATAIDSASHSKDLLVVQAAGNIDEEKILNFVQSGTPYPSYLGLAASRLANPAQSLHALTVGSVSFGVSPYTVHLQPRRDQPSLFSRVGPGIWETNKPDVVEYGGDIVLDDNMPPGSPAHPESLPSHVRSTLDGGAAWGRDKYGTSFAAPRVTRLAAQLQARFPDDSVQHYRALIAQSARWPEWAVAQNDQSVLERIGYGLPDVGRATTNNDFRITLKTSGHPTIKARECHIYRVQIPESLRSPSGADPLLLEVTLAYSARPRRSRRRISGYLSTWLDWRTSNIGESEDSFARRVLRNHPEGETDEEESINWTLGERSNWGQIDGVSRRRGSLHKDWAIIRPFELPESFCIAVVGHPGWDPDPDSSASFALCVTFESIGQRIQLYERIRLAQQVQVQTRVTT